MRVTEILNIEPYYIICTINHSIKKKIEILPLIEKHAHFKGIENLKNKKIFTAAKIGEMGEIYWKNLITLSDNQQWNYDISPEFILFNGENV
jgi:hypothetical protein